MASETWNHEAYLDSPCGCGCGSDHIRDCPTLKDMQREMEAGTMCPTCGSVNACYCHERKPLAPLQLSHIIEQIDAYNKAEVAAVHEHGYDAVFHPRMCKPGCHRFPGGSQYCSHCGITRTDLVASFPRN